MHSLWLDRKPPVILALKKFKFKCRICGGDLESLCPKAKVHAGECLRKWKKKMRDREGTR